MIETQDLIKKELTEEATATIIVSVPGAGKHIFTGIRHFHVFVEDEATPEKFGVKEICSINEDFEIAVHKLVLRRLIELL
jgi:hypothetical protein